MATTQQPKTVADEQQDRTIEDGRLERALTEDMQVEPVAPGMYDVRHDDETYVVDVEGGSCGCKDHQYRGDKLVCKHVLKACVRHAFTASPNTRLVARVLSVVKDVGCVHGVRGCAGPTQLGERPIPCEGCIAASGAGHWVVWQRLVAGETPADAPVAMTDGGTEREGPVGLTLTDVDAALGERAALLPEDDKLCLLEDLEAFGFDGFDAEVERLIAKRGGRR